MITETMTQEELNDNIFLDFALIRDKYISRISAKYKKLRLKNKIKKDATYSKSYEFRTPSKNNWLLLLSKPPSMEKYKGEGSTNVLSLVYYYNDIGLRVFKIIPTGGISVFNAHFFTRYDERMHLNLDKPIDKVKHYFINNGYSTSRIIDKDGRRLLVGTCKSGFMLGELQFNGSWAVYKTFIPKDYASALQEEIDEELKESMKAVIEEELNKVDFNREDYFYNAVIYKGITDTSAT